jgi:hypothetical protein
LEFYDYFLGVRYFYIVESLFFLTLLIACMVKFGKLIQGDDKPKTWSSPAPASKMYSAASFLLWACGASFLTQPTKILIIIGLCLSIAGIQLAFHVDLMMMGIWYLSKTGRTVLGLGSLASKDKHKFYLERAKQRGKLSLAHAKNHGPIWREQVLRWY